MAISIAKLAIHLTTETGGMVRGFQKAKALTNGFASSLGASSGMLAAGPWGAAAAAAATAAAAISGAVYQGVAFNAMMEQSKASLTGFTGSAKAAEGMLGDLFQFAATTPFQLPEIVAASKTMLAMGAETEDVMAQMRILGQVAAGSGQPINELANIFGQVQQAGRLTGNELRQFNERGIPVLSQLSKNLGKTKQEIRDLVEAGKITSADVVQAFADMSTGTGIFAGQMDKQAETLIGQWTTFKDNMIALIGDLVAFITPALTEMLRLFNRGIEFIRGTKRETEAEAAASIEAYTAKQRELQKVADAEKAVKEAAEEAAKAAKKRLDELKSRADSLTQSLRNPAEVWRDSMNELNELMNEGLISWETYTRAIEQATQKLEEQTNAKKNLDAAYVNNPALMRGSQGALSAINESKFNMQKQIDSQKRQEALIARGNATRDKILAALDNGQQLTVNEVRL